MRVKVASGKRVVDGLRQPVGPAVSHVGERQFEFTGRGADPQPRAPPDRRRDPVERGHQLALDDSMQAQDQARGSAGTGDDLREGRVGRGDRPHPLGLVGRPGQHDDPLVADRHDAPGCGADRGQHVGAARQHRLLALGGVADVGGHAGQVRRRCRRAADQRERRVVEREWPAGRAGHRGHGQVVVGDPEPTGGDHQVDAGRQLGAHRSVDGRGVIAEERESGRLDAARVAPARQVAPVAVGDAASQELIAGDDDRGSRSADHAVRSWVRPGPRTW